MSSLPALNFQPEPFRANRLAEMYESDELFNEGLLDFEYPLFVATDEELDYFLGGLIKKVANVAKDVGKVASQVAKDAGKAVNTVSKVVPMSVLTSALSHTPMGMAVKAGLGAISAAASGKNVFQGALRSLASDPATRFMVDTGMAAARGKNILKAAGAAAQAGIGDVRESLRFAAMVAPFVPGVGTGVGAALAAANALASGQRITDALLSAAKGALPGGAIAQTAFDVAVNLAQGKNIAQAALLAARNQLPGGPAAQAAFDAGLALAKGRSIQDAAFAAAGRLLPKSPYSADALSFVKKVASGQNIQKAALSAAGNLVMSRIEKQVGSAIPKLPAIRRELEFNPEYEYQEGHRESGRWVRKGNRILVFGIDAHRRQESFEQEAGDAGVTARAPSRPRSRWARASQGLAAPLTALALIGALHHDPQEPPHTHPREYPTDTTEQTTVTAGGPRSNRKGKPTR